MISFHPCTFSGAHTPASGWPFTAPAQHRGQELAGVTALDPGDILGRACGHDLAAAVAALGAEVDEPVRGLDHLEIVLDHDNGIALLDQFVQHLEQFRDVVEMQSGRRLVQDVQGSAGGALRQLLGELDALRLAARERGGLLADMDVVEADAVQKLEYAAHPRHRLEEAQRLLDRHVEHVGDRLPLNRTSRVSRL